MVPRWLPLIAAIALTACERDSESTLRSVDSVRAPTEILVDLRNDGTRLFATVLPPPPFSDAPRAVIARWVDRTDAKSAWSYDGLPVLDARLIPDSEAAVVITRSQELVLLPSRRALPTPLDSQVHAPLSLSQDGRFLAYARGEIPDLEIVRYDLVRRAQVAATQRMAPAWSPALSDNGSRVLFVSGSTGSPELWELREDQSVVQRTDRKRSPVPFPSGPSAPVWSRDLLAFEDQDGVHLLGLSPVRLLRTVAGVLPVAANRSQALIVQHPAGRGSEWLPLDSAEVGR